MLRPLSATSAALTSTFAKLSLSYFLRRVAFPCASLSDSDSGFTSEESAFEHLPCSPPDAPLDYDSAASEKPAIKHLRGSPPVALSRRKLSNIYSKANALDVAGTVNKVKAALSRRGWDLSPSNATNVELDERNVIAMLNDLFDGSAEAALLAYDFFRLSKWYNGSKHGVRVVCVTACIFASANLNYKALSFIRSVVRIGGNSEEWSNVLFDMLRETTSSRAVLEIMYSMLVGCFLDEGMLVTSIKLVNKMRGFGFVPSIKMYKFLIARLLSAKQMELAWEVFVRMPRNLIGLLGAVVTLFIRELCVHGNFDSACQLLFQMDSYGGEADIVAYTTVIDALCKRGLLEAATILLFKMLQRGIPHDAVLVSSMVDGYCKAGRLAEAVGLLRCLSIIPDAYMYHSFILKFCRDGNVVEACQLFNEMLEVGPCPDSFIYTTLVDGYCKICQIDDALKIFALMVKKGIQPTVFTYTVLLDAYCKRDDLRSAEFVLRTMRMEGAQPDIVTYNTLINGYCKKGNMHKAYALKDMMEKAGLSPDITTYNILMHGLIKRGFVMESRELFNELIRRGLSPDRIAFTNVIDGCSNIGNLQEAFLIWCSMSDNGITPDVVTCSALLNCFRKKHHMEDAKLLFHKMLDFGLKPDLILYNTLIGGFCEEGNIRETCDLLTMMREEGIFPNKVTFNALVYCLEKIGVTNAEERATMELYKLFHRNEVRFDEF